ncbi:MAG: tail fiber domain-containing protein [Candidatus Gastranaerophilales bacterium]|nr:tail fiber domain-containing protein [Candidatus Gastranaerophilales bacterium]
MSILVTVDDSGKLTAISIEAESVNTDTINEKTTDQGVTIESVPVKDGLVDGVDISENINQDVRNTSSPTFVEISTDTINEKTTDQGVTIESVPVKDGLVDGVDISENINQDVRNTSSPTFEGLNITSSIPAINLTTYNDDNNACYVIGNRARGTIGNPQPVQLGDFLIFISGKGYGSSDFSSTSRTSIQLRAAENWSDTAQGAKININVTPNGSTTFASAMTINENSAVYIGASSVVDTNYLLQLPNSSTKKAKAQAWDTYSDSRIKKDLGSCHYGLNEILQLKPRKYTHHSSEFVYPKIEKEITNENGEKVTELIDDLTKTPELVLSDENIQEIGFFAQEIYEVIPEVVSKPKDESKELWSISQNKLIPVLVNSIRELNDIIQKQQKEIDELKQKIS